MADLTQKINRIANNVAETYSVLEAMGAPMPANANSDNLAATAANIKVVKSMTYDAETNKWTLTYTDGTTSTVDGPAIPDVSGYMPKTGGTFTGQIKASASGQAPGESLVRNIKFSPTEADPTVEGELVLVYG